MRCLYCGKELALLKRWTRGGQFCSEAHKKSYQEEYNRIGLSRLLQAQTKPKAAQQEAAPDTKGGSRAPTHPGNAAPVAVEEAPIEILEEVQIEQNSKVEEIPEEIPELQAEAQEAVDEKLTQESAEPAWEPDNMAGFVKGAAAEPVTFEFAPYSHPWHAGEQPPVAPLWQSSGVVNGHLPEAPVLELKFRPNLAENEHSAPEVKVTPNRILPGKPSPPAPASVQALNQLPSAGLLKLGVSPSTSKWAALEPAGTVLNFPLQDVRQEWSLLKLHATLIAFPADDTEIEFDGVSADGQLWGPKDESAAEATIAEAEPDSEVPANEAQAAPGIAPVEQPSEPATPSDDLSHLSEELARDQEPAHEPEPVAEQVAKEPASEAIEQVVEEMAPEPEAVLEAEAVSEPEPVLEAEPVREAEPEPARENAAPHRPGEDFTITPRSAENRVEIPLKIFTPVKPSPVEGAGALIKLPVFIPGLTGLPLRPKMGLVAPTSGSGSKKTGQRPGATVQPAAEGKTPGANPDAKPVAETNPVVEATAAEAAVKEKTGSPAATVPAKPWGKPTAPPSNKESNGAAKTAKPQALKTPPAPSVKVTPAAPAKPREDSKPKAAVAEKPAEAPAPAAKPKTAPAVETRPVSEEISAPSFGAADNNTSFLGSLKGKLAVAGAAVALCLGAYFLIGGKSPTPVVNPAAAADKAGPSIMVGSGGWVEGWAGDPDGAHLGRQITIYRPSLKLSDYRIEFKGEIEHKSLGWVFRAADPENYYAMKLAIVTPGLEPKIALVKSVVAHGRETAVAKTPINLDVRLDTQYTIRVDVRGSKFTTYVQGQQVDTWSDDQFKAGGVGFLNEREERGRVKSVSVSLLNGGKQ